MNRAIRIASCLAIGMFFLGCSAAKVADESGGGTGDNGGSASGGGGGGIALNTNPSGTGTQTTPDPGAAPTACDKPTACADFPSAPIIDPNSPSTVPSNAASQFSGSPSGAGPCVVEPEDGSLYPYT